jgi:hypothetical protein
MICARESPMAEAMYAEKGQNARLKTFKLRQSCCPLALELSRRRRSTTASWNR